MTALRHTLVSDGVADANLIPIIDWSLREIGGVQVSQGTPAEFWRLPARSSRCGPNEFRESVLPVPLIELLAVDPVRVPDQCERTVF